MQINRVYLFTSCLWGIILLLDLIALHPPLFLIYIHLICIFINLESAAHPIEYINEQITLHKERIQNRRRYELFKSGVKDGLFTTDEQIERENRRIVK